MTWISRKQRGLMSIGFIGEFMWRYARGFFCQNLRKLKQIKYVVGMSVTVSFILLLAWIGGSDTLFRPVITTIASTPEFRGGIHFLLAGFLTVFMAIYWSVMPGKYPLAFSDIEYHVLQAAPLSRRSLVQWALLKGQRDVVFDSLLLWVWVTLIFRHLFIRAMLAWLFFSILIDLHMKCSRSVKFRIRRQKKYNSFFSYTILYLALSLFCWLFIVYSGDIFSGLKTLLMAEKMKPGEVFFRIFAELYQSVPQSGLFYLLSPVILALVPFFETSGPFVAASWALLVILLVFHWEWLVRTSIRDWELMGAEDGRADLRQLSPVVRWGTVEKSKYRTGIPFTLPLDSSTSRALYWKYFLVFSRVPLWVLIMTAVLVPVAYFIILILLGVPSTMVAVTIVFSFLGLFFAVFMLIDRFQRELREEIMNFDLIRTFPVEGWRLFAIKVLAISTMSTLVGIFLLGMLSASILAMSAMREHNGIIDEVSNKLAGFPLHLIEETGHLFFMCLGILAMYVGLVALIVIMQTFLNLFVPHWLPAIRKRDNIYSVGQTVGLMFALLVSSLISVLPACLVIGTMMFVRYLFDMPFVYWDVTLYGMVFLLISGLETSVLVMLAGKMWDKLDPAIEQV